MPFVKNYDESKPVRGRACIHFRSKAIYVTGELDSPEHADHEGSQHSWCNLTQHVRGPDQKDCERCHCIPGRECYQDSYDS